MVPPKYRQKPVAPHARAVSRCTAASRGETGMRHGRRQPEAALERNKGVCPMLDKPTVNTFSHVKPGDTPWVGEGLRDFFLYRDLGVATATGGRVLAQLVKANSPPEEGTGWH
jgi:hypothetical protein